MSKKRLKTPFKLNSFTTNELLKMICEMFNTYAEFGISLRISPHAHDTYIKDVPLLIKTDCKEPDKNIRLISTMFNKSKGKKIIHLSKLTLMSILKDIHLIYNYDIGIY